VAVALRLAKVFFFLTSLYHLLHIAKENFEQRRNIHADLLLFSVAVKSQIHRPGYTVN
jgi:hypothetical protein